MAEERRIPEVERLESRDMPSALGVPYLAPPIHLSATHAVAAPQVVVLTPTAGAAAGESTLARDVLTPLGAGDRTQPLAADVVFARLAEPCDALSPEWAQPQALSADPSTNGVAAAEHQAPQATDAAAAAAVAPSPQHTPTITGVLRYAWKSVNRHRLDDPSDAVQQIGLEWLLLAATIATTYDDVRRIVARVIDRAYWRQAKQRRTLELPALPARADPIQDIFRDLQLDRDLGVRDLTDQEWQVLGLRRQGYTFAEIGAIVGMPKQRAREVFKVAAFYLRDRYRD